MFSYLNHLEFIFVYICPYWKFIQQMKIDLHKIVSILTTSVVQDCPIKSVS